MNSNDQTADNSKSQSTSSRQNQATPKQTVVATRIVRQEPKDTAHNEELVYQNLQAVGQGSFGTVYSAKLVNDMKVAIKKVLQDRRFKNRELSIMKRMFHPNVVTLLYYFYTSSNRSQDAEVYLNLVMDYVPENVYKQIRYYSQQRTTMPLIYIKLYIYQLFRALNYIHKDNICHRDIKPQNLLCNSATGVLKLCDFGSAKQLDPAETNVSYICSRYYRAPELILCAMHYSCAIDVWSCGCVFGELLLNQPLFPGETGVDQLVEIIKIIGTPSREQTDDMNPDATKNFHFPLVRSHPWNRVFRNRTPQEALDLINIILEFSPQKRIKPIVALNHTFFKELRDSNVKLPNGNNLPMRELYQLSIDECSTLIEAKNSWNGGSGKDQVNMFTTGIFNDDKKSNGTNLNGNNSNNGNNGNISTDKLEQDNHNHSNPHNNTLATSTSNADTTVDSIDQDPQQVDVKMIARYIRHLQGDIKVTSSNCYDHINMKNINRAAANLTMTNSNNFQESTTK